MAELVAFTPNGPNRLESFSVVPAESLFTAAQAVQGGVIFSEGPQTCGIQDATPHAKRMDNYPSNELAHTVTGKVRITPDSDETNTISPSNN